MYPLFHFRVSRFLKSKAFSVLCSTVTCWLSIRVFHEHFGDKPTQRVEVPLLYKTRAKAKVGHVLFFLDFFAVTCGFNLGHVVSFSMR